MGVDKDAKVEDMEVDLTGVDEDETNN